MAAAGCDYPANDNEDEGQHGMQREASNRLRTAHLALSLVALVAAAVVIWGALRPDIALPLPASLRTAVWVATALALTYLLACAAEELLRYVATASFPPYMLWATMAAEGLLVLIMVGVLIRGHGSRGLLARLDILLPALIVVVMLAMAIAIATRRETSADRRGHLGSATALVRLLAAAALAATLLYLELQPLPNTLVR